MCCRMDTRNCSGSEHAVPVNNGADIRVLDTSSVAADTSDTQSSFWRHTESVHRCIGSSGHHYPESATNSARRGPGHRTSPFLNRINQQVWHISPFWRIEINTLEL